MEELLIPGVFILVAAIVLLRWYLLKGRRVEISGPYTVVVDYSPSLMEMVARGNYDLIDDHVGYLSLGVGLIEDREDRTEDRQEIQFYLARFPGKPIIAARAVKELERKGYCPVGFRETLAFGAQYSDEQWNYPIAGLTDDLCLGVDFIYDHFAFLYHDGEERSLDIRWADMIDGHALPHARYPIEDWGEDCRFLVTPLTDHK